MVREAVYQGYKKYGDILDVSFYNLDYAALEIVRLDNNATNGSIYLSQPIPKQYTAPDVSYMFDTPYASYDFTLPNPHNANLDQTLFRTPSITQPVEGISGRGMTFGTGLSLAYGSYASQRFVNKYAMVPVGVGVYDTAPGIISAQENGGNAWSISFWVYDTGANIAAWIYMETNNVVSNYMGLELPGAPLYGMNLTYQGGVIWNGAGGVGAANVWNHVVMTYDGAYLRQYNNGVLSAGPSAHTHLTGFNTAYRYINYLGTARMYVQSLSVYPYALTPATVNRLYTDITNMDSQPTLYNNTLMTLETQYSYGAILFTNTAAPAANVGTSASYQSYVVPMTGHGHILFGDAAGEEFMYELRIPESESVS